MTLVNADGVYKSLNDSYRNAGMPKEVYLKFKRWLKKNEVKSEPNVGYWEWFEEWSFNGEVNECDTAGYRCSICKKEPSDNIYFDDIDYPPKWKYCPNCGASLISLVNRAIQTEDYCNNYETIFDEEIVETTGK